MFREINRGVSVEFLDTSRVPVSALCDYVFICLLTHHQQTTVQEIP